MMPKGKHLGLAGLLEEEPLDVDPLAGFEDAFAAADAAHPLPGKAPPPVPEVELEGAPTIRPEAAPRAPVAPLRPFSPRMGPFPKAAPPNAPSVPAARSPLRPAAGGDLARLTAQLEESGKRLGGVEELIAAQQQSRLTRDADAVGDALYSAFTRTRPAPDRGGPSMADDFAAQRALGEHEEARGKAARAEVKAAEDLDPASTRSRSLQALGQELYKDLLPPETWTRLPKSEIDRLFPVLKDIEAKRTQREFARTKREEDRTNKLTDIESQRDYQRGRDVRQNAAARERAQIIAGQKDAVANEKRAIEEKEKYLEGYTLDPAASPKDSEVQKVREAQAATRTIQATAKEIADLYRKHGTQALPTAERARMQSLVTDLQLAMKGPEMFQLGVLAGPDMAILDRMVPDVTGAQANILDFLGGAQIIPKLEALEGQVGRKFENKARALGYRKAGDAAGPTAPERVRLKDGSVWERAPDGSAKRVE
jgi:hypothetical protein